MTGATVLAPGTASIIMFGVFFLLLALRVPVAFALGLACLPIFLIEDRLTPQNLVQETFNAYNSFILLAVPFFLLAANIMNSAGITERLVAFTRTVVGHFRGGLAQINVVVSMIFAGISGSSTADAAGEGSLIIPAMRREGYDASFTVAITACSSVMGVIIPPSILMVVWGGIMSVSIGGLFLAGFLPGIMVGLAQMVVVYFYARARNYPVYPRATFVEFARSFGAAVLALMSPVIVVGGVVGGFVTPTEASVLAVMWSLAVGFFFYRSLGVRDVRLLESALAMPQAGMGGQYFHADLQEMAASLDSAISVPVPESVVVWRLFDSKIVHSLGERLVGLEHQREQLSGAVDGLRPSLELLFHARYVTQPCSSTQCRATRSSRRTRWRPWTRGGAGWSPRSASSS